ncbi:MAG TPA: glycerol-3-phosphate acyltransferase [Coriobacteriia bacterium]
MSQSTLYAAEIGVAIAILISAYLIGSIPWAYIIVRRVTGEDITAHGTGNVGAMNVRRTTGSWGWFIVAMAADAAKGFVPVLGAKALAGGIGLAWLATPWGLAAGKVAAFDALGPLWLFPPLAVAGAVLGHNYSVWLAINAKKFSRTGKGLATGGGALLAYDWRYFLAVVIVGVLVIALTRYMMAGQVAAAFTLPVAALLLRSPDWPFALVMGLFVYAAHHKRFMGLLRGEEPKLYLQDGGGPKG